MLLANADAANITVEIINAPEIKPHSPVMNNAPIAISFFIPVITPYIE